MTEIEEIQWELDYYDEDLNDRQDTRDKDQLRQGDLLLFDFRIYLLFKTVKRLFELFKNGSKLKGYKVKVTMTMELTPGSY